MTFNEFKDIARTGLPDISEEQFGKFEALTPLYEDWNSKINVISRKDIDCLYDHHVLHSLSIAVYLRLRHPEIYESLLKDSGISILDLGTGGGFPGIPLAVIFPNVRFTLCDSVGKKIKVASEVAKALKLNNVETVNTRAESLPGRFDYVVARAVAPLDLFLPWVKGKFHKGVLCLKGGDINEEIISAMEKFKIPKGRLSTWQIDSWLPDSYYAEKFLIHISSN